jgi:pectate lyase
MPAHGFQLSAEEENPDEDLQGRMSRLRSGDVHAYNLYVDNFTARVVKVMRDEVVAANPALRSAVGGSSPNYKFGITSNGAISTEGGAIQLLRQSGTSFHRRHAAWNGK